MPHDWLLAPYNDSSAVQALFDAHGDGIAAVPVEPMQGSGMAERGYHVARRGFVVLSLPLAEAHLDGFVEAFESFVDAYRPLL